MNVRSICCAAAAGAITAIMMALVAFAADCKNTSIGETPINDLGKGLYLNQFQGGLYPNGLSDPPAPHLEEGLARAQAVQPLDADGKPDPDGKYVLLSIGMSNTSQEFCGNQSPPCQPGTFMAQAATHPGVNHETLVIANGAKGGEPAAAWEWPNQPNYNRVRDQVLAPMGLTEAHVQIVWVKQANPQPNISLPDEQSDAYRLVGQLANIARAAKARYPNLQMIFFSSRIYAGYASTALNPEPYAYESGFAVKWLIEAQINQMAGHGIDKRAGDLDYTTGIAPWLAWGPYLWADGLTPRSDGLIWTCANFAADGTHPSQSGRTKVGTMLMQFMLHSPLAQPWFRISPPVGDLNSDWIVDVLDLLILLDAWGQCPRSNGCPADLNADGVVDVLDLLILLDNWG